MNLIDFIWARPLYFVVWRHRLFAIQTHRFLTSLLCLDFSIICNLEFQGARQVRSDHTYHLLCITFSLSLRRRRRFDSLESVLNFPHPKWNMKPTQKSNQNHYILYVESQFTMSHTFLISRTSRRSGWLIIQLDFFIAKSNSYYCSLISFIHLLFTHIKYTIRSCTAMSLNHFYF